MSKLIGIDLGTTNSCVAVMERGECVVIPNESGDRTTPSVVAFTKEGERLVGKAAKHQAVINPQRTISSIKRDMGSDKKISIDSKKYTPQEISAMILSKLKTDAENFLRGKSIRRGYNRSRVFYRRSETSDKRRGNNSRAERKKNNKRAHGGGFGLRGG